MINLISNEIKNNLKKVFYIRLLITFLILMSIAVFFIVLIISPLFFFTLSQKKLALSQLKIQNSSENVRYEYGVEDLMKNLNSKLNIVDSSKEKEFIVSNKINKILSEKIEGIKITDISFVEDQEKRDIFKLRGSASSRETLLLFKNILQKNKDFKNVDLPISSFIQKTNIQFNLILTSS